MTLETIDHPEPQALRAYRDDTMSTDERARLDEHFSVCAYCSARLRVETQNDEETPALAPPIFAGAAALQRGGLLGRYVILEVIGAGGMGEVYSAIDPELDRKVAVKLVKAESRDADKAQTRLLREAQAMAKLSHPNVVSIYDVGVVDGRVFLAMEFVYGATLTQSLLTKPRGWREVIAIFREAGAGLAAAHSAGMVHRDFKPDNVLIGNDGRVRVSDFGLARSVTDSENTAVPTLALPANLLATPVTHAAQVLGTPAYMAPEQFAGKPADARSDQFSFCVALYKSLYGQPPFPTAGVGGLVQAVLEGVVQAPPPNSQVPLWVHRVLLRGLSVSPDARFASLELLVAALGNDPSIERTRRLKAAALVAFVIAVVATAGFVSSRMNRRCTGAEANLAGVWDTERQNQVAAAFEKSKLSYSGDLWRTLKSSLDTYAHDWVEQHTSTCEATRVRGEQSDEVLGLRMRCLNDRLHELRSLTALLVELDADGVKASPKATGALTELTRCSDLVSLQRRVPLPKNDQAQRRIEVIGLSMNDGVALLSVGRFKEALHMLEAVAADAKAAGYAPLEAQATHWLIRANGQMGAFEKIRGLALDTIRLAELAGDDRLRFEGILSLAKLGNEAGSPLPEMLTFCQIAKGILPRFTPHDFQETNLQNAIGNLYLNHEQPELAIEAYREGLAVCERSQTDLESMCAALLGNLATVHARTHRLTESIAEHQRELAMLTHKLGPNHPQLAGTLESMGSTYSQLGDHERALELVERGVKIREAALSPDSALIAESLRIRGLILTSLGRFEAGERDLRRAYDIAQRTVPGSLRSLTTGLSDNLLQQGKAAEALAEVRRSNDLSQKLGSSPLAGHLIEGLALKALGRATEAEEILARVAVPPESEKEAQYVVLATAQFALAQLAWARGEKVRARSMAELALTAWGQVEGDHSQDKAAVKQWLQTH